MSMENIQEEVVKTTQEILNEAQAERSTLEGNLSDTDYAAIKKGEGCDVTQYEQLFKDRASWRVRINELKVEECRLREMLIKEAEEFSKGTI